jgi:Lipoprotein amino terminal region
MQLQLTYRSEGTANGQSLTLGLAARLQLEKVTPTRWQVQLSAPLLNLQQNGESDTPRQDAVAQALVAEPFALEVDGVGHVTQLWVPARFSELVTTYLRLALSPLVLCEPRPGTGTRAEVEAGGHYTVAYAARGKHQWERRYLGRLRGEQSLVALPGIHGTASQTRVDGATQLQFLPSGTLQSIVHKRTQQTQLGAQVASTSTETLTVCLVSQIPKASLRSLGKLTHVPLLVELPPEKFELLIRTKTLGSETESSLFALLDSSFPDDKTQLNYLLKLQAFFYLHPEHALPAVQGLVGETASGRRFMRLTSALAAIGTPTAQRALLSLLAVRHTDLPAALWLLGVLSSLATPLSETVQALEQLSNQASGDLAAGALLALGALASALTGESQSALVQRLEARLSHATTEPDKRLLLLALGNAGAPRSLAIITRFTKDDSPVLRAAATRALRHLPKDRTTSPR